ncbi:protein FAM161A isoform X2 [Pseudophryne corroboree]|uniref:protein FAM161A isoform X2 n=1 Tax=Pseudophryne corroboree TaxID=495146 RepID=UPI003081F63B
MARSHRDCVLAAACVQTPVHPHTRGPATLYERQEAERQRLGDSRVPPGAEDDPDSQSDTDGNEPCKMWNYKDWVLDISKLHHSDKEYYMQLKRLKNAHMHNMDQLEEMYEHKLHLKGTENTAAGGKKGFRSTWEHQHATEIDLCRWKHDISHNVSCGLSESSLDELTDGEDDSDTQSTTSAREKIVQMWNGFTVEDYIKNTGFEKQRSKHKTNKSKEWSHRLTVPEPFEMTIRESKKKEINAKSKSEIEMENILLKKRLEEEAECQKKFRANPVPAFVYLPLYQEIVERNEERRKFVKDRSKEILLASQKPFWFIDREERKKAGRKVQLTNLPDAFNKSKHFKAKPVPKSIYGTSVNERLKEEQLYREIRIHMRSQELLHNSFYPTSTLACKSRKTRCYEPEKEQHKPKINTQIPNFEVLHQNQQIHSLKTKNSKHVTICDPFQLRTANLSSHLGKILKDIEEDEEVLKETRWPYKSPRSQSWKKSTGIPLHGEPPVVTPRSTESSKRRAQAVRKSVEERLKMEDDEIERQAKKKQKEKILKKHISRKAKALHPEQTQKPHSKLKELRKNEKRRTKEYMQELGTMKERISQTPLLLERATQKNARLCAEKHYSNVLRDLGLCDDFVSTKGHAASLQDPVRTNEDDVSSADEESNTEGPLEIEDLQEDGSAQDEDRVYRNESEDEKPEEYSSDEDHSEIAI